MVNVTRCYIIAGRAGRSRRIDVADDCVRWMRVWRHGRASCMTCTTTPALRAQSGITSLHSALVTDNRSSHDAHLTKLILRPHLSLSPQPQLDEWRVHVCHISESIMNVFVRFLNRMMWYPEYDRLILYYEPTQIFLMCNDEFQWFSISRCNILRWNISSIVYR